MRVLVSTDHYPPFIGGAHRWAQLLAAGLHARGHEVAVLTEWHGGMERVEGDEGWEVHRIRQLRTFPTSRVRDPIERHSPPFFDPVSAADASKVIDAFAPEVCISHGWITHSVIDALKRRRVPVMLSAHDYGNLCATRVMLYEGAVCSGPSPLKCLGCATDFYGPAFGTASVLGLGASRRRLAKRIDGVQTVSSFVDKMTYGYLLGPLGPAQHVRRYIIPPFVEAPQPLSPGDQAELDTLAAQLPDEPFIMFAGALRTIKGVHVLVDAYRRLRDPKPPMVLMGKSYAGDTPDDLPAGVQIVESAPHALVMEGWRRALLGVVPSIWPEPCATVAIECSGVGTPTVATTVGGFPDILGEDAGLLVNPGSADDLAEAMQRLIDDPQLRASIGEAGRHRARRFDAERVLGEYEQALLDLIADRAKSLAAPPVG